MKTETNDRRFEDTMWRYVEQHKSSFAIPKDTLSKKLERWSRQIEYPFGFRLLRENLPPALVIDESGLVHPNLPAGIVYHTGESDKLLRILDDGLKPYNVRDGPATVFLSIHPHTSFTFERDPRPFMVEVDRSTSAQYGVHIVHVDPVGNQIDKETDLYGSHETIPPQAFGTVYLVGRHSRRMSSLISEVEGRGFEVALLENPRIPGGITRHVAEHHAYK